jgi:hypothetical protein
VPHPFINEFKKEWVQYPFGEHDDCLDAVYWMLFVGLPHMMGNTFSPGVHDPVQVFISNKVKAENPFEDLGYG